MKKEENNQNYLMESYSGDNPDPLSAEQMDLALNQMKLSICKIKKENNFYGTGFFCKIPFPNPFTLLPVLITCNHVLNINDISQGKKINFSLNNEEIEHSLLINEQRKTYTNKKSDTTIIEIKPEEDNIKIESFLDLDENIYKNPPNDIYRGKSVYILHYEEGQNMKYSLGKIKAIAEDNFNISHSCKTKNGSSGGPIINLFNYKVMGIHKGTKGSSNLGTNLRIVINDFNEENKKLKNIQKKEINITEGKNLIENEKTAGSINVKIPNEKSIYDEKNFEIFNKKYDAKIKKTSKRIDLNGTPKGNDLLKDLSLVLPEDNEVNDLRLADCEIDDISALNKLYLPKLEKIDLSFNEIINIEPLCFLKENKLGYLYLNNNNIRDISPLKRIKFSGKGKITIENNKITYNSEVEKIVKELKAKNIDVQIFEKK